VLQGAANAALDYHVPGVRLYDSVHVLVAPAHLAGALAALREEAGLQELPEQPRSGRRRGVWLVAANGVRVELHRTLAAGSFGGAVEVRDLLANRVWFSTGDIKLSALGAEARLVAASLRARLDGNPPHLLALRDVVQLVLRDDLSLREVERWAVAWRVEAVLADAVRRAWQIFGVPDVVPISAWSRAYRPDRRDLRRLATYTSPVSAPEGFLQVLPDYRMRSIATGDGGLLLS
jgi:hypothetical protein